VELDRQNPFIPNAVPLRNEEERQKELHARRAKERRAREGEGKKRECVIM